MKPGISQSTQLRQELKINPRLYQAMDLLYMPLLDLQQHLKQELLNNPFLDLVEEEEEEEEQTETEPGDSTEEEKRGDEIDWEEILLDGFDTAGGRREEHEEREYFEPVTVATRDLSDHLRDQVSLLELTPREMLLRQTIFRSTLSTRRRRCSGRSRASTRPGWRRARSRSASSFSSGKPASSNRCHIGW